MTKAGHRLGHRAYPYERIPHTADATIGNANARGYHTNTGATGLVTLTLGSDWDGPTTFAVTDADGLRINAPTGQTIRVGARVSASGGYIESTEVGAAVTLVRIGDATIAAVGGQEAWGNG
jgi:hypothetical protein